IDSVPRPMQPPLFPYTTLFRSNNHGVIARVLSAALVGVEAALVRVEVDVTAGLPAFTRVGAIRGRFRDPGGSRIAPTRVKAGRRSEEHTSELPSRGQPVCRPLL